MLLNRTAADKLHLIIVALATDVPFIASIINSPSTFTYYLDMSNFLLESELSYFRVLSIYLPLVCFLMLQDVTAFICIVYHQLVNKVAMFKISPW